jgi:hypothetical protein
MKLKPLGILAASVILLGCSAKTPHQESAYITKPITLSAERLSIHYAMNPEQLKLYQPYVETFLYQKGLKLTEDGKEVVIAPVYIGSILIYNKSKSEVKPLPAIPYKEIKSNTGYTLPLSRTFYQSLGYDPIDSDYSSISEGLEKFGIQTVTKAVFTYGVNALLASDGYQIITDVYIGGERTRIFAHTLEEDGAEEAIPVLIEKTAKKIAELINKKKD